MPPSGTAGIAANVVVASALAAHPRVGAFFGSAFPAAEASAVARWDTFAVFLSRVHPIPPGILSPADSIVARIQYAESSLIAHAAAGIIPSVPVGGCSSWNEVDYVARAVSIAAASHAPPLVAPQPLQPPQPPQPHGDLSTSQTVNLHSLWAARHAGSQHTATTSADSTDLLVPPEPTELFRDQILQAAASIDSSGNGPALVAEAQHLQQLGSMADTTQPADFSRLASAYVSMSGELMRLEQAPPNSYNSNASTRLTTTCHALRNARSLLLEGAVLVLKKKLNVDRLDVEPVDSRKQQLRGLALKLLRFRLSRITIGELEGSADVSGIFSTLRGAVPARERCANMLRRLDGFCVLVFTYPLGETSFFAAALEQLDALTGQSEGCAPNDLAEPFESAFKVPERLMQRFLEHSMQPARPSLDGSYFRSEAWVTATRIAKERAHYARALGTQMPPLSQPLPFPSSQNLPPPFLPSLPQLAPQWQQLPPQWQQPQPPQFLVPPTAQQQPQAPAPQPPYAMMYAQQYAQQVPEQQQPQQPKKKRQRGKAQGAVAVGQQGVVAGMQQLMQPQPGQPVQPAGQVAANAAPPFQVQQPLLHVQQQPQAAQPQPQPQAAHLQQQPPQQQQQQPSSSPRLFLAKADGTRADASANRGLLNPHFRSSGALPARPDAAGLAAFTAANTNPGGGDGMCWDFAMCGRCIRLKRFGECKFWHPYAVEMVGVP